MLPKLNIILVFLTTIVLTLIINTLIYSQTYNVTGVISYDVTDRAMSNTEAVLALENNIVQTDSTDEFGAFSFTGVSNGVYLLTSSLTNMWQGVTAVDALLILKNILGVISFNELQLMASDINVDGNVTAIDALLVLNRAVGLKSPSWKILDWVSETKEVAINGTSVTADLLGRFSGDLNSSAFTNPALYPSNLNISLPALSVVPNSPIRVPISVNNFNNVGAVTLEINYDPTVLKFEGINDLNSFSVFNLENEGKIMIAAADINDIQVVNNVFGTLEFTYKGGTTSLEFSEQCEIANSDAELLAASYSDGRVSEAATINQWGFLGGRTGGWELIQDNAENDIAMGGANSPAGNWSCIRGQFSEPLSATLTDAVVLTGKIEFVGTDIDIWSLLRFGIFYHNAAGDLENPETQNASWNGSENGSGYLFIPHSGTWDHVTGNDGIGDQWAVEDTNWLSTWRETVYSMGIVNQAPKNAMMSPGKYNFGISVQAKSDGTNEIKWYLQKDDESYWVGSTAIDSSQVTTEFNGVCFGINPDLESNGKALYQVSLSDLELKIGDPVIIPQAPGKQIFETEPNNSADLANEIEYGDTVYASISDESDVDYYKFNAESGDTIEIYGDQRNESQLYGRLYLVNSIGTTLRNSSSFTSSYNQRIQYVITQTGTYYVRYSSGNNYGSFPNRAVEDEVQSQDGIKLSKEKLEDSDNITTARAYSGDYILTITNKVAEKPIISTAYLTGLEYDDGRFVVEYYPNGLLTEIKIDYGTTTSYGNTLTATAGNGINLWVHDFNSILLESNTTYYYRVTATNTKGNDIKEYSFKTPEEPEGWVHQSFNNNYYYFQDVDYINENIGWAVGGYNSVIYKTTNGGVNWTEQSIGYSTYFYGVEFTDANIGWVVGDGDNGGAIYKTTDGGMTWTAQNSGLSDWQILFNLKFIDSNTGWIVGQGDNGGTILKTTDGGTTWTQQSSGLSSTQWFLGLDFVDGNTGWIVGNWGVMLKTIDGGSTWIQQIISTNQSLESISFADQLNGIAVGYNHVLLKTNDGGANWTELNLFPKHYAMFDVKHISSTKAVLCGNDGLIAITSDGGTTWTKAKSGTMNDLNGISIVDENHITIVGDYGTILTRVNNGTSVDWQTEITVADAGGARSSKVVTIGQDKSATDGLDPELGESELPPNSLGFEARLKLPNSEIYSWKDFRNSSISDLEWELIFKTEDENLPITLSWDPTRLPEGSFIISDKFDGILFTYNMKEGNSCVIPNNISALKIIRSTEVCSEINLLTGWNMVSAPVLAEDMSGNSLFPNKEGSIYKYENGYQVVDTIKTGVGYWEKNSKAESVNVCGVPVSGDIIVKAGWNMIGIYDISMPVGNITSSPANITTTPYYGYNTSGYYVDDTLKVGEGYWIKCSQDGVLQLNSTATLAKEKLPEVKLAKVSEDWGKVTITDARERSKVMYLAPSGTDGELYSVPPAPPEGIFDVRFSGDSYVKEEDNIEEDLLLSSVVYPVRITVEGIDVRIADKLDGSLVNKVLVDGSSYVISNESVERLLIEMTEIPISYELKQNYPNPFNPSTTIQFGLPEVSKVKLHIYNVLGQRVATLIDKQMDIGYHKISFDASQLASGVYIYRIETPNFVNSKKMLLMK